MNKIYSVFSLLLLLHSACKPKKDKVEPYSQFPEKPVIEIVYTIPVMGSDFVCGIKDDRTIKLNSSGVFKLEFNLKAKEGLSQYKIDIHNNFDCHAHKIAFDSENYKNVPLNTNAQKVSGTSWKVLKIIDIEGQQKNIVEELQLPSDVIAGNYHFMIQCVDTKGNEASFVIYNLKVENTGDLEPANIQIVNPSTDSIAVNKGDNVYFSILATDNQNLDEGRIELTYLNPSSTEFTVDQHYFPIGEGKSASYNYTYMIPNFSSIGVHIFVIKVYDKVGNVSEKQIKVNVLS